MRYRLIDIATGAELEPGAEVVKQPDRERAVLVAITWPCDDEPQGLVHLRFGVPHRQAKAHEFYASTIGARFEPEK